MMRAIICFGVATLLTAVAHSGSLTPPGAPAPTMKTLDDVEARIPIRAAHIPLIITQPGSYYLAETISFATPAVTAIQVNSGNVVIDLNGYTLQGPGSDSGTGNGIHYSFVTTGTIVIKNGTVRDWDGDAMELSAARNAVIQNVNVAGNRYGIVLRQGRVSDCVFKNNYAGLLLYNGTIRDNEFIDNEFGMVTSGFPGYGGEIKNNFFKGNSEYGIRVNNGDYRVEGNTIQGNGVGAGLVVQSGTSLVVKNSVSGYPVSYDLVPTCSSGPIFNLTGGTLPAASPWANFEAEP